MIRFTFLFVLFLSTQVFAQDSKNLEAIESYCKKIDADVSLKVNSLDPKDFLDQQTDRKSSLDAYFDGTKLVKIEVNLGFSHQDRKISFYFETGQLIKAVYDFKPHGNGDGHQQKASDKFYGEYYFVNGILFHHEEEGIWRYGNPSNDRHDLVTIDSNFYREKVLGK